MTAGLALLALVAMSGMAHAQATRTWVSGVGDDANPCSRTAPCKTFAGSISKTATGGEINCLDQGAYGAVTIAKSISIVCIGVTAGVLATGGSNGIIVNLPNATSRVLLDGLDIDGFGTGLNGIRMIGQGKLIVRRTSIRNFTNYGVDMVGAASSPAPRVLLQDVLLTGNNGGFSVSGPSGTANNAEVVNSLIDTNAVFGIQVNAGGSLVLTGSVLTGQPTAIVASGGGAVVSYGNNVVRNNGTPTQTLPLQ